MRVLQPRALSARSKPGGGEVGAVMSGVRGAFGHAHSDSQPRGPPMAALQRASKRVRDWAFKGKQQMRSGGRAQRQGSGGREREETSGSKQPADAGIAQAISKRQEPNKRRGLNASTPPLPAAALIRSIMIPIEGGMS
jgi:hypothetical protein